MKIRAIVTGATGMVGEGVLHECLLHPDVEAVLVLTRKPCGVSHPKLKEVIVSDFFDLKSVESQLTGYNACFFCLGVSVIGLKEHEYYKTTYELTMNVAQTVSRLNPDMVFCYVSGTGTDSTGKGKVMWARIKGKTENDLMKLPFRKAYMFRPGFMKATDGAKNTLKFYKYVAWMYPMLRRFFPKMACTLAEVGHAMINAVLIGDDKNILDVLDIVALAQKK
jgi:uncharacterized protein YbjT (DUF2867 family)